MGEAAQSNTGRWTVGDIVGLVGGLTGVASLFIAGLSWWEASQSRKIAAGAQALSEKSFDRSAGKGGAEFSIVDFSPTVDDIPQQLKFRSFFGTDEVRLESLDQLLALNPRVTVQNAGDEIIEALRVETKFVFGMIDTRELSPHKQRAPTPWVLRQVEREDHQLGKKLMPGQRATVAVARGLVSQMLQAQATDRAAKDHYGRFEIRCYGRLVGLTAFDGDERNAIVVMNFVWLPTGFTDDRCKKFLETFQPDVEIAPGK